MTNDPEETQFVLIGGQTTEASNIDTTFLFDWSLNNNVWVQLGSLGVNNFWHACGATKLSDEKNIVVTNFGDMNNVGTMFLDEGTTTWYAGPSVSQGRK